MLRFRRKKAAPLTTKEAIAGLPVLFALTGIDAAATPEEKREMDLLIRKAQETVTNTK